MSNILCENLEHITVLIFPVITGPFICEGNPLVTRISPFQKVDDSINKLLNKHFFGR